MDEDFFIGRMLRALRQRRKVSQATIAEVLNVPQTIVSRLERGTRHIRLGELRLICQCLEVSMLGFISAYLEMEARGSLTESDLENLVAELIGSAAAPKPGRSDPSRPNPVPAVYDPT